MDKRKQAWHDIRERRGLTLTPYRGWRMYGILRPDQRRAGQEALRQSVIWTVGEDDDLRAQVAAGARFEDIAAWHMRLCRHRYANAETRPLAAGRYRRLTRGFKRSKE